MEDHRWLERAPTRDGAHAAAEMQLRTLADDVLALRRRGLHDRADVLTRKRDGLARAAYATAIGRLR